MKVKILIFISLMVISMATSHADNIALLIGIGDYNTSATGWSVIHGNNDVVLLEKKLKEKSFVVSKIIDNNATKQRIMEELSNLIMQTKSGDVVYLHFSGHGQLIPDLNNDEKGRSVKFDQSFVCYDACISTNFIVEGTRYKGQNHLIDDELFPFLNILKKKAGQNGEVIVVFDSCFSGGADRGRTTKSNFNKIEVVVDTIVRGTNDVFRLDNNARQYIEQNIIKPDEYSPVGNITVISACEWNQINYECKDMRSGRNYGSLSYCISKLLEDNISFSEWRFIFENRTYIKYNIFSDAQHPTIEVY